MQISGHRFFNLKAILEKGWAKREKYSIMIDHTRARKCSHCIQFWKKIYAFRRIKVRQYESLHNTYIRYNKQ